MLASDGNKLEAHIRSLANEHVGEVMVWDLCQAARDWLEGGVAEGEAEEEEAAAAAAAEESKDAAKQHPGTPVTVEAFERWRVAFETEQAEAEVTIKQRAEHMARPSGRKLFEMDAQLVRSDLDFGQDAPIEDDPERVFSPRDEDEDDEDDEDDEEEEESIPADDKVQRRNVLLRSLYMMGFGTLLVLVFSDPMVDVMSNLGKRMDISGFYISFVLAPLASNASELIAGMNYASKKTVKTVTISISTFQGAASMNNTFCLAIFLALVYVKELSWQFSAETISILFVEMAMLAFSLRSTQKVIDAFFIFSLYPISLGLVYGLEQMGFN
mmetsp:Transcript_64412/g.140241  ORF Transcript_64412/g.140241 Transcript_64412/m.140241 type:complete len:327 (+) Transcript_64412:176-1156(+)